MEIANFLSVYEIVLFLLTLAYLISVYRIKTQLNKPAILVAISFAMVWIFMLLTPVYFHFEKFMQDISVIGSPTGTHGLEPVMVDYDAMNTMDFFSGTLFSLLFCLSAILNNVSVKSNVSIRR